MSLFLLFRGVRLIHFDSNPRSGTIFGSVIEFQNDVRLKGARQLGWGKIRAEGLVYEGEAIFSGDDSLARLRLSDESEISLQPNSLIVLQSEQVGQQAVISLKYGDMQLESAKPKAWSIEAQGKRVSIKTSEPKTRIKLNLKEKIEIKALQGQAEIQAAGASVSLKNNDEPLKLDTPSQVTVQDIHETEYAPSPKLTQPPSAPVVQVQNKPELKPAKKPPLTEKAKPKIKIAEKVKVPKPAEAVIAKAPLTVLRIKEPFKGAQIYFPGYEQMKVKFYWDPASDVDGYQIQFAQSESFNVIEFEMNLKQNELIHIFKKPAKVYWRVRGIRGSDEGPWSEPRSVQVSQSE